MNEIEAGILGLAIGDALGVPVEFTSRAQLEAHPVDRMYGHGTYRKPAGTWSDDTSLTLALADSLSSGEIDYCDMMGRFIAWYQDGAYTTDGHRFDIGTTTLTAFQRFLQGAEPTDSGGCAANENGNGSLMRILPITYYLRARDGLILTKDGVDIIHNISSLTHGHPRSRIACVAYCNVAHQILEGRDLIEAVTTGLTEVMEFYSDQPTYASELHRFTCFHTDENGDLVSLTQIDRDDIRSSGYVVDTLDAALWCLVNHEGYPETVLAAVNLGSDTDTTGAVCGSLAGLYYQLRDDPSHKIPEEWLEELGNKEGILGVCRLFDQACEDLKEAKNA
ncbi:MAG: ADP-ribosylglycohydrolase family protein [Propionibacteriaceae bacterium]|nr:ADP-ribosylglycohydrolase family protein [Propionibacteriaceae bacterium]